MDIKQQFGQAFLNLSAAKLRSILAVLGILVGTASVVALVTSGQLATQKALQQFKTLGTDLLAISLYQKNAGGVTQKQGLTLDYLEALGDEIPTIRQVAPYASLYQSISFSGHPMKGSIVGANSALQKVIKIKLAQGVFVNDLDTFEKVCVIGDNLRRQIEQFTLQSPIGLQLKLGEQYYTIIGVAAKWLENGFFNEDINASVIIPIRGIEILSAHAKINHMVLSVKPNIDIDNLIDQVKGYVLKKAPKLTVFPRSAKQIIKSMQSQGKIFTLMLGLIGGISLLVGGIGVMNVMLVAVTERRKEIGIRKAIGARHRDILILFLIESIVLSLFGGGLGVLFGLGIANAISAILGWGLGFYSLPIIIGFGVSALTGIFFGFYPAYRASRLNPIVSLRCD